MKKVKGPAQAELGRGTLLAWMTAMGWASPLQRYLNEFSFRFNNRKAADLFGMTVRRMALAGNPPYAKLVEENAFTPFVRP
jgi:hypothetical protein